MVLKLLCVNMEYGTALSHNVLVGSLYPMVEKKLVLNLIHTFQNQKNKRRRKIVFLCLLFLCVCLSVCLSVYLFVFEDYVKFMTK